MKFPCTHYKKILLLIFVLLIAGNVYGYDLPLFKLLDFNFSCSVNNFDYIDWFNQNLNTTSNVTFNILNVTNIGFINNSEICTSLNGYCAFNYSKWFNQSLNTTSTPTFKNLVIDNSGVYNTTFSGNGMKISYSGGSSFIDKFDANALKFRAGTSNNVMLSIDTTDVSIGNGTDFKFTRSDSTDVLTINSQFDLKLANNFLIDLNNNNNVIMRNKSDSATFTFYLANNTLRFHNTLNHACNSGTEGTIGYNYTSHAMVFCNGTNWLHFHEAD